MKIRILCNKEQWSLFLHGLNRVDIIAIKLMRCLVNGGMSTCFSSSNANLVLHQINLYIYNNTER